MADQELTDLEVLAVLATDDLFFVRDKSAGIDKQVAVSSLISLLPPKDLGDLGDVDLTTSAPNPGDHLEFDGTDWVAGAAGGGTFISLGDTPASYVGSGAKFVQVNIGETALEFVDLTSGDLPSHTHAAADVISGTFAAARIAESSVTQHEAAIDHDALLNFVSNEHVDHSAVILTAGVGLSGGGDISASRTFDLDIPGLDDDASPAGSYTLAVHDGTTHKEVTLTNLLNVGGFLTAEINDLSSIVTWANVPEANITQLSVTQHEAALTITESQIQDLQAYVLPTDSIDILVDVDTTNVTPTNGDMLSWNGTNWVPASGMAPGAHASTHVSLGSDEIDGDVLDIDFVPTFYTPTVAPSEVTTIVELTAHLAGIDVRLGQPFDPTAHTHTLSEITDSGTAASKDFPAAGDAAAGEVVLGNDSRLTDSRTPTAHVHDTADITTGTFVDARIAESNVTQHEAALEITESQISDLTKTIITQDEGLTVTGGPHTTLNFVGAGVTAADGTGGVTTITIPGGGTATFVGLTDTPSTFAGSGTFFVRVNAGATDLEFVADPGYLTDITAESIGDLSDVSTGGAVDGQFLRFNGASWVDAVITEADISDLTHDIAVQDEGSGVANTPHSTLNFVGTGVVVTDGGSGVATITISGGGGGGTFVSLTDTPADYTGGVAGQFVKVNGTPDAVEFAALVLGDLPAIAIGDLSDVDTTTSAPVATDVLAFDGTKWVPSSPSAPGAHAASHVTGGADLIDGDILDITFVPSNYTRDSSPAEVTLITELTAHLKGLDVELLTFATTAHAVTHVAGGSDEVDGDILDIDFSPANYTPNTTPAEVTLANELTAHLAGIDLELATVGSLPKWDRQMAHTANLVSTTSTTFIDIPGLTLTTKDLGSGQNGSYLIHFSSSVSHASQKESIEFQLLINGAVVTQSVTTVNFADPALFLDTQFSWYEDPIADSIEIKVQWRQTRTSGSIGNRTASLIDRRLIISGIPSNAVVV